MKVYENHGQLWWGSRVDTTLKVHQNSLKSSDGSWVNRKGRKDSYRNQSKWNMGYLDGTRWSTDSFGSISISLREKYNLIVEICDFLKFGFPWIEILFMANMDDGPDNIFLLQVLDLLELRVVYYHIVARLLLHTTRLSSHFYSYIQA